MPAARHVANLAARVISRCSTHVPLSVIPASVHRWPSLSSHLDSSALASLQPSSHGTIRHLSWLPWRQRHKQEPVTPPTYPKHPQPCSALGKQWVDDYEWVRDHSAVAPLLQQEGRYYRQHAQRWAVLRRQLEREMWAHVHEQVEVPEVVGSFEYLATTSTRGHQPTLIRRPVGSTGAFETVLSDDVVAADAEQLSDILGSITGHDVQDLKLSKDQRLLAYTISIAEGSEDCCGCVRDLCTGQLLPDCAFPRVGTMEFAADGRTLIYTVPDATGRPSKVMRHALGSSAADDSCIFEEADPACFVSIGRTKDWRYLVINSHSKLSSEVHILDAHTASTSAPICLQRRMPGLEYFVEYSNGTLLCLTNADGAMNYCLMAIPAPSAHAAGGDREGSFAAQHKAQAQSTLQNASTKPDVPLNTKSTQTNSHSSSGGGGGGQIVASGSSDHAGGLGAWSVVLPERPGVAITDLDVFQGRVVLHELRDGLPALTVVELSGILRGATAPIMAQVPLPDWALSIAPGANQDYNSPLFRFSCSSPVQPPCTYDYHFATGELQLLHAQPQPQLQLQDNTHKPEPMVSKNEQQSLAVQPAAKPSQHQKQHQWQQHQQQYQPHHQQQCLQEQHQHLHQHQHQHHLQQHHHQQGPTSSPYTCHTAWVTSHDGTQVPLTLAHKADLQLHDKPAPVLLVVYGAYGQPLERSFEPQRVPLLDRGWVLALAHVRGGGELGRRWHAAGRQLSKANSVQDLLACARYLVDQRYTTAGRIGGHATSAGAFTLAAAVNAEPELFGAVVLQVPFVDVLSSMLSDPSHLLTAHEVDEWGDPCTFEAALATLASLCPYHNLAAGKQYPATLVTAGLCDERVPFWGPVKYVAKLRACRQQQQAGQEDVRITKHVMHDWAAVGSVLLRFAEAAGHHSPTFAEQLAAEADEFAFLITMQGQTAK